MNVAVLRHARTSRRCRSRLRRRWRCRGATPTSCNKSEGSQPDDTEPDRGIARDRLPDFAPLELEVRRLKDRADELDRLIIPSNPPQQNAALSNELINVLIAHQQKDQELFTLKHGRERRAIGDALVGIARSATATSRNALRFSVTRQPPRDLSVWGYLKTAALLRMKGFWKDLKTSDTQIETILRAIEIANDVSNAAQAAMIQVALFVTTREVRTSEDFGAVLGQRQNAEQVLEALEVQHSELGRLLQLSNRIS